MERRVRVDHAEMLSGRLPDSRVKRWIRRDRWLPGEMGSSSVADITNSVLTAGLYSGRLIREDLETLRARFRSSILGGQSSDLISISESTGQAQD